MNLMWKVLAFAVVLWQGQVRAAAQSQDASDTNVTVRAAFTLRSTSAEGESRVSISAAAVATLWSVADRGHCSIDLPLSVQQSVTLDLQRFEVLSPSARFVQVVPNKSNLMPPPRVLLLRGSIHNEPGSRVFLSIPQRGRAVGRLLRATGEQFLLRTERADNNATDIVIQTHSNEWPDSADPCGTQTEPHSKPVDGANPDGGIAGFPGTGGTALIDSRGPRALVVAVDADQSFTQLFPSTGEAQEYIVQVIGAVSDIYLRDLNFRLVLDFSRLWPDGGEPFSATNLSGFRNYWLANENLTGLNLVHMFSGRRDLAYGGIAFLANSCNQFGFGISGFLLGDFPSPLQWPHLGNWDVIVVAHEMGHNLGTPHTHDYMPPIDQCTSGVFERGSIMSYCHTNPGGLLNTDLSMHRLVAMDIANDNAQGRLGGACLWHDCNANGVDDLIELQQGAFLDNNRNGIPDSCEDCNSNDVLDPQDIAQGAADVNQNGVLDACEADCNNNALPDDWEIRTDLTPDINGNGIPDSCEPDCDGNGVADFLDIRNGTQQDIDRNAVPDVCQDCNSNGVPDWIDVDRQFNIFVAQTIEEGSIREYHATSGVQIRDVGFGAVSGAYDVAFGPDRQLYAASFLDHRIVRIDVDSGTAGTFVESGSGGLNSPSALTFGPDGHLYVSSQNTSSVLRYHGQTGAFLGTFVTAGGGGLSLPWGLTFGPNGNLFVISSDNRIVQYDGTTGEAIGTFAGGLGPPPGPNLNDPRDLVFLADGTLLVTNRLGNNITHYASNGSYLGVFNDNFTLTAPWGIAIGRNGNVYAARSSGDVRVIEYNVNTGKYVRSFIRGDTGLTAPTTFAVRPASPTDTNGNGVPDSCELLTCPADISPQGGNNAVDIGDLLIVINSWDSTGAPGTIPGDIFPMNGGDGIVNIDDLLLVIQTWGPCP
jgi:sugar lactone lactonase YvrE